MMNPSDPNGPSDPTTTSRDSTGGDAWAPPPGPVDCDELFDKLDLLLDRELPQHELDRLETHLAHCLPCAGRRDFETQLRAVVRERCADQAPDDLVRRIRERLDLPLG